MQVTKRRKIFFGFLAISALLVWFGRSPDAASQFDIAFPDYGAYSDTGYLSIVYSNDNGTGQGEMVTLFTDEDSDITIEVDEYPGIDRFNGDKVFISGTLIDADTTRNDDAPVLVGARVRQLEDHISEAVVGNSKWVNVACRFSDMTDETPRPREYFEDIMKNQAPGMDHYWRTTSAGLVNIEGSTAYGWYNLPQTKDYYLRMERVNVGFALRTLLTHCAVEAVNADGVDFEQFDGINIMLNDTFGCCAWGGSMPLNIDGKLVQFRTTWLPPWAFNSLHVIAHEMGHGFGLPHSSGPYGQTYDSAWDVMSGGTRMMDVCRVDIGTLGCHQVGTIGHHLDKLGWIPRERVVVVEPGESAVITLDALTTVRSGIDMMLVEIPVAGKTTFYTAEVRNFVSYDRNVPGEAVVLHEVVPGRASPAHVVDADGNGNVNDEGAMWMPGETFTQGGITVEVLSRLGNTFTIRVTNQ